MLKTVSKGWKSPKKNIRIMMNCCFSVKGIRRISITCKKVHIIVNFYLVKKRFRKQKYHIHQLSQITHIPVIEKTRDSKKEEILGNSKEKKIEVNFF